MLVLQQPLTEAVRTPSSGSGLTKLLPGNHTQHLGVTPPVALYCVCEHLLYHHLFCISVSKMCPKAVASCFAPSWLTEGFMGMLYFQIAGEACNSGQDRKHLWHPMQLLLSL